MSKPFCKGPVAYPLHYTAYINPIGYHTLEFYTIKKGRIRGYIFIHTNLTKVD